MAISRFRLGVACVVFFTLMNALSAAADVQPIAWRSAADVFVVKAPVDAARDARQLLAGEQSRRVIVRFDRPVSHAEREAMSAAGMRLLASLGSNAFFAHLDGPALNVDALSRVQSLRAVQPVEAAHKMHRMILDDAFPAWSIVGQTPATRNGARTEAEDVVAVCVLFHPDVDRAVARQIAAAHGAMIRSELRTINGMVLELPRSQAVPIAMRDEVQWVEPPMPALQELNAENREVTQANEAQEPPYNLDGSGVKVMVFDGGHALASHSDFGGRLTVRDNSNLSNHATHVSGTIGGDGTGSPNQHLRGMAPGVTIESYGFQWSGGGIFLYTNPGDIETDYDDALNVQGVTLANNSIGTNTATNGFPCSITGEYGLTSSVIDSIVRGGLGSPLRVVWANGNERQSTNCGNLYYTTAPPACAKNHLTVGALNADDNSVTSFTSWGPCNDGRLKPDVSAPGCKLGAGNGVVSTSSSGGYSTACGTSMACPTVTGLAALLLQDFRNHNQGDPDFLPSTMKALFVQTAMDLQNVGPDHQTGYGLVQVRDAIDFMRTDNFLEGQIVQGQMLTYIIHIDEATAASGAGIKATLAWDDFPASPNVTNVLVNDLDIIIVGPGEGGGVYYPWTLNPADPGAPAVRTVPDRVNNLEQVVVDSVTPGIWTVHVIGHNVPEGPQRFSLAAGPKLVRTLVRFPEGLPAIVPPGQPTPILVRVHSVNEDVVSGSPTFHYRVDRGDWAQVAMQSLGGELYQAVLPALACGMNFDYFFTAQGSISGVTSSPAQAPQQTYLAEVGVVQTLFADDFDEHLGWTVGAPDDDAVAGIWELADPVGTFVGGVPVQPSAPFVGLMCYITGQHPGGGAGANDVDFGKTTLFSPVFDVSKAIRATVSYQRWYSNSAGANPNVDVFQVDVSADGGQTWVNAETVGPAGPGTAGGWYYAKFDVNDLVPLTSQVQVRFVASDYDPQALVEAAIDRFRLRLFVCDDVMPACPGDLDANGQVDVLDLLALLGAWGPCAGCPADLNLDGTVDVQDLLILLGAWGACP